jgi:hypothetical protein
MRNTVRKHANPAAIVDDYEELVDLTPQDRCAQLWKKYGKGLQQAMAEGVVLTARLWEAAWREGDGPSNIKSLSPTSRIRGVKPAWRGRKGPFQVRVFTTWRPPLSPGRP